MGLGRVLCTMSEEKRKPGAPRKGASVRISVTRKFSPELISALEGVTTNQSEFIEGWMWTHPLLQNKRPPREHYQCSQCEQEADIECKIGKCAPSTWYCFYHYMQEHLPEDERD
jgi:hypothetical protein